MTQRARAVSAAEAWLALLDAGDHEECWELAATLMRRSVSQDQLAQSLRVVLVPLGTTLSRTLDSAEHHEELPGAPDGLYWVLRFAAVYMHKRSAIETVTAMWDRDDWRVSGYFIR